MTSNNLLEPLQRHRSHIGELADRLRDRQGTRRALLHKIENYKSFAPKLERSKIDQLENTATHLSQEIKDLKLKVKNLENRLKDNKSAIVNWLIFWKFFTNKQKLLRIETNRICGEISTVKTCLFNDQETLSKTLAEKLSAQNRLSYHENFNLKDAEIRLTSLEKEIEQIESDQAASSAKLEKIETKIQPIKEELDRMKSERDTLNENIDIADLLCRELSSASDSYGRKKVHEKCGKIFDTDKPRKVIKDSENRIQRIDRSIPKLERRIREELQKLDRNIRHPLIDGTNACYQGQRFIKLRGISSLLNAIRDDPYEITVVFDAKIRKLLKTDDQNIKQILGPSVTTYIAPSKGAADEYLLNLAGEDQSTFILSNDRYIEFLDYDAVKSDRLIKFLIADEKFIINELDISINI